MTTQLAHGRELDALVAEKVMNWKPGTVDDWVRIPFYSTSIEDAWKVVEKIAPPMGWVFFRIQRYGEFWEVLFEGAGQGQPNYRAKGSTAPYVICLAALRAVEALEDNKDG